MAKDPTVITEKMIETSILDYLRLLPRCRVWKNQTVGIYNPTTKAYMKLKGVHSGKGSPDIIGVIDGKFIGIEVKKPVGSQISQEQIHFINDIRKAGGIAFFANSLEQVILQLKNYKLIA